MNNILQLRYVVEVERTGSISKAAENLYMAQPYLSKSIRELEESLGITIFNRTSKGVFPTKEGLEFLAYAKNILRQIDEMESLYKPDTLTKKVFRICVPRSSYIAFAFAEFVKELLEEEINFSYREANSSDAIKSVVDGVTDLGIIRYPVAYEKYFFHALEEKFLEHRQLLDFQYMALMSKEHPLADMEVVPYTELRQYMEIVQGDMAIPALPIAEARELSQASGMKKKIDVYERGSQFEMLHRINTSFMWGSPIPADVLRSFSLVQRKCDRAKNHYKDMVIFRKGYEFTREDQMLMAQINTIIANVVPVCE